MKTGPHRLVGSDLVELRAVSKRFGPKRVLVEIDCKVGRGDRIAILGANGAGKSTLLKLIAGLVRPTSGIITRNAGQPPRILLSSAGVPLVKKWDAWASARYLGGVGPDRRSDLCAAFERFGVLDFAEVPAGRYSLGMAQRLMFALASVLKPDLLLLDEAFHGLDREALGAATNYVQHLEPDCALVVATHDLLEAASLCETTLVLEQGRLLSESYVPGLHSMEIVTPTPDRLLAALDGLPLEITALNARRFRISSSISTKKLVVMLVESSCELQAIVSVPEPLS